MDERKGSSKIKQRIGFVALVSFVVFASYSAYIFLTLPKINNPNSCFQTKMAKVQLCPKNKNYIRYSQIPKIFIRALVLSEDAAFFSHKGLDWHEIKESFRRNFKEWKFARGGSTLTQQLAKNLYLTKQKTIARKIKEFFIAKELEKKLKKSQILEKYVNVVEFGKNIYGINKASSHYFSKQPSHLNLIESIYLVSLLPSPVRLGSSYNSKELSKSNLWRMNIILGRLFRSGRITQEVYDYSKEILETHSWPFPHYEEGRSYLGRSYENEEAELNGNEEEQIMDGNEMVEEEINPMNETIEEDEDVDGSETVEEEIESLSGKNEELPNKEDSAPDEAIELEDAESPEN